MSIHPSLSSSEKDKKARSVLKRTERLRSMLQKGEWKEGDKVYGLPKIKTVRIKIKKEKIKEATEAIAGVEGAAPAAAPETQAETPSKTPAPRGQEKPEKK
ncbi:MAG: small basic protein [Candidatus Omnitrophica bacterium]|nr:small basic protein [Candidatus Omnitrophota bacterium]